MGITIRSKNFSYDMGYLGFMRFRTEVATQASEEFGELYSTLSKAPMFGKQDFFKDYDEKVSEMVKNSVVSRRIANFCHEPDAEARVNRKTCKAVYELIKDCDDNLSFGYSGRVDCTHMENMKLIFKDCAENGLRIEWY